MKTIWKWIIGLVVVLVVVAALVAVPFAMRRVMVSNVRPANPPAERSWNAPLAPGQSPKNDRGFDGSQRGFAHFGRGRMPFGMFGMGFMAIGMIFHLVVPLALFGLLLFGVYQLGKRSGARSALTPAPVSTQAPPTGSDDQPVG